MITYKPQHVMVTRHTDEWCGKCLHGELQSYANSACYHVMWSL